MDVLWKDPPRHDLKPVGKARQTVAWAQEKRQQLRRRPGQWALLKSFDSPSAAWQKKRALEDMDLFEGCELKPTKSEEHRGSELYGRFVGGQA